MAESYLGQVQNGVVVFDEGTPPLPEGSRFRLQPMQPIEPESAEAGSRTIAERYAAIIGIAEGLPEDLAMEHDHYIHGTPRREEP